MIESAFIVFLLFLTAYFEVFLLLTFLEERRQFVIDPTAPPLSFPSVTIIIPAWNEENTLLGTLRSLLALDYPTKRLSLFVVDDGSTDRTLEVARRFEAEKTAEYEKAGKSGPTIRVFTKENGGKHTAMNLGISMSSSDLIGCLDADSFVAPDALLEIVRYMEDPEVMAVTPSVQIYAPNNGLRRMQSTEYMVGQFTRKLFSRLNALYVTPGPFSVYRRDVFARIGPFEHAYGTEDMEMALRMQANRMRIENAHTAFVYTVCPETPHALYKQRVRWVTGFLKNAFFKYRHMFFDRRFGHLGMLTIPFAFGSIFIALFFAGLYLTTLWTVGWDIYLRFSAVGFHPKFGLPKFDWFAITFDLKMVMVYILLFIMLSFIYFGVRLVRGGAFFSRNTLWFLALYGFIAPFWLAKSLYNLVTHTEAKWR